jgi:hypothetical protein
MSTATPPAWAEALLASMLSPADRDAVTGDLLEQYRDTVDPQRGHAAANRWYIQQVAGFAWRRHQLWVALLVVLFFGRSAYDAFEPTATLISTRAQVTTWTLMALWAGAGFTAAWRTRLFRAGLVAGAVTSVAAGFLTAISSLLVYGGLALAPHTYQLFAIQQSGGIDEVLLLPFVVVPFATALAGAAGIVGGLSQLLVHRLAAADVVGLPGHR